MHEELRVVGGGEESLMRCISQKKVREHHLIFQLISLHAASTMTFVASTTITASILLCCLLMLVQLIPTTALLYSSRRCCRKSSSRGRISLTPLHDTSLASASNNDDESSPRTLIQQGMQSFRNGDVRASLQYFDRANNAVPDNKLTPYLWQRGISYYYLDKFQEGHEQFSLDVKVNPLDVEEIVWDIACLARMQDGSKKFPVENQMSLPNGKKDRRKIMSTVYSLFRGDNDGTTTEYTLREAGHNNGNSSDEFYSLFYLGLYCEIRGETSKAEMYMKMAERSKYATGVGSGDYMSACARVHCKLRGWV